MRVNKNEQILDKNSADFSAIEVLSFDLDDTLWPLMPTVKNAEQAQWRWLRSQYPQLVDKLTPQRASALREALLLEEAAELADVSWMRQELLRRLAASAGLNEAEGKRLADGAFSVFLEQRCAVKPFADALEVLPKLAERYPLIAITNGNADVFKTDLAALFKFSLSPVSSGIAKPDVEIFQQALDKLGVASSAVLHIGDSVKHDVVGAAAVGMRTVLMQHEQVDIDANGPYKNAALSDEEEHGADVVVRSLHELAALLL